MNGQMTVSQAVREAFRDFLEKRVRESSYRVAACETWNEKAV